MIDLDRIMEEGFTYEIVVDSHGHVFYAGVLKKPEELKHLIPKTSETIYTYFLKKDERWGKKDFLIIRQHESKRIPAGFFIEHSDYSGIEFNLPITKNIREILRELIE